MAPACDLALLGSACGSQARFVASHLLDKALSVLAADERLDGVTERVVWAGAEVDGLMDDHG
jgi:hypothetical protein